MKFVDITWAALFARHRPVSTKANPACMNITKKPVTSVQTMFIETLLCATFLTNSELAPTVVFPASSIVGSPVLRLVLGSVLAGAGQIRSMPVPLLLAVAVESGPTGVGDGDAAGVVAVAGDPEGLAFCATADAVAKTAKQRTETRTPYLTNVLFESICFSWSGKAWSSVGQHASSCSA